MPDCGSTRTRQRERAQARQLLHMHACACILADITSSKIQYYYVCVLIIMYMCHRTSSCTHSQIFTSESVLHMHACACVLADSTMQIFLLPKSNCAHFLPPLRVLSPICLEFRVVRSFQGRREHAAYRRWPCVIKCSRRIRSSWAQRATRAVEAKSFVGWLTVAEGSSIHSVVMV